MVGSDMVMELFFFHFLRIFTEKIRKFWNKFLAFFFKSGVKKI